MCTTNTRCARRACASALQANRRCSSATPSPARADYLLVITASTMADYEALTGRLFGGDDNVRRFRTSVALGCLKVGLQVPLDRCGPVA
jgi:Lrp/AsnC family leucine-responsive transcriptional regulator